MTHFSQTGSTRNPQNEQHKPPLINCHTHIFIGDHVPPYLAKTFIPWPFYLLLPLSLIVRIFRWYFQKWSKRKFQASGRKWAKINYHTSIFIKRSKLLSLINMMVGLWVTVHVFYFLVQLIGQVIAPKPSITLLLADTKSWLNEWAIFLFDKPWWAQSAFVIFVLLFFKPGRNLIFWLLQKIWSFFKVIPGPQSKELLGRYLNLGRFSFLNSQGKVYGNLKRQYPLGTGFVVLPMDMEFMEAGNLQPQFNYHEQMNELKLLYQKPDAHYQLFPFIFAEPRRMSQDSTYFKYTVVDGEIGLEDCFVKEYLEIHEFKGIKIYPALGYYPFDEELLPLWLYAAKWEIPILTHCIRGTIFYRGSKKKEWDYHPVIEQPKGDDTWEPMLLKEIKNKDFTVNFTHPLNYLCLLEETLLRKLVGQAKKDEIRALFGYTDADTPLKHNLNELKICFGHFGGEDEWKRFFELDRDNYSSQLLLNPLEGIQFQTDAEGNERRGKLEQIWHGADWYSIICSMMLQYPNIYGDLSYIIHDEQITALLNQTLQHPVLKTRVLFGTDFYVVRNHKSEKNMLAEIMDGLSEEEFDQIARTNPRAFLHNEMHATPLD